MRRPGERRDYQSRCVSLNLSASALEESETPRHPAESGHNPSFTHAVRKGLAVAEKTIANFVERAARLYEQEQCRPRGPALLGAYVRRWAGWVCGGVAGLEVEACSLPGLGLLRPVGYRRGRSCTPAPA
jgi:hypothetical protein